MKTNDILLAWNAYTNDYQFMQVVKTTAKTATIKAIRSNRDEGTPRPNDFSEFGRTMTKRIGDGDRIHLGGWESAEPWNGEPLQIKSPFGMNTNLY